MWLMPEITFARFTVPTSTFFSHGCSKHYGTRTTRSERMNIFASSLTQSHSAG